LLRSFAVRNHGLEDLIQRHFEQTRAFFALPMKRKMDVMIDSYHRCGAIAPTPPAMPQPWNTSGHAQRRDVLRAALL
jgi:isopenicillin N synthase-like dioxygenase